VTEVVNLTLDLYRRNCIEGLFLSSGIARTEDDTMSDLIAVAKCLREEHGFKGYIHLKTIPGADKKLIAEAGLYADRLSMNVEMPNETALSTYAPEKKASTIRQGLATTRSHIESASDDLKPSRGKIGRAMPQRFAPAGQSTQMIVGADRSNDIILLRNSAALYASYALKRVYYSAFSPTGHPSAELPDSPVPLVREHRLYQADWLLRFYGFGIADLENAVPDGMLPLDIDPKLAWALRYRDMFPVDVNRASRETLLRVPGLGVKSVDRIITARCMTTLGLADLARLNAALGRARPFIVAADWRPTALADRELVRERSARPTSQQLDLFG
jgi:putative DNA modification/repair radical SAM protein